MLEKRHRQTCWTQGRHKPSTFRVTVQQGCPVVVEKQGPESPAALCCPDPWRPCRGGEGQQQAGPMCPRLLSAERCPCAGPTRRAPGLCAASASSQAVGPGCWKPSPLPVSPSEAVPLGPAAGKTKWTENCYPSPRPSDTPGAAPASRRGRCRNPKPPAVGKPHGLWTKCWGASVARPPWAAVRVSPKVPEGAPPSSGRHSRLRTRS